MRARPGVSLEAVRKNVKFLLILFLTAHTGDSIMFTIRPTLSPGWASEFMTGLGIRYYKLFFVSQKLIE